MGEEQSPAEPWGPQAVAVVTTAELQMVTKMQWNCQVLQSHSFKVRPRKDSPDLLQSPVRSLQVLSCISLVFGLGEGS